MMVRCSMLLYLIVMCSVSSLLSANSRYCGYGSTVSLLLRNEKRDQPRQSSVYDSVSGYQDESSLILEAWMSWTGNWKAVLGEGKSWNFIWIKNCTEIWIVKAERSRWGNAETMVVEYDCSLLRAIVIRLPLEFSWEHWSEFSNLSSTQSLIWLTLDSFALWLGVSAILLMK